CCCSQRVMCLPFSLPPFDSSSLLAPALKGGLLCRGSPPPGARRAPCCRAPVPAAEGAADAPAAHHLGPMIPIRRRPLRCHTFGSPHRADRPACRSGPRSLLLRHLVR